MIQSCVRCCKVVNEIDVYDVFSGVNSGKDSLLLKCKSCGLEVIITEKDEYLFSMYKPIMGKI